MRFTLAIDQAGRVLLATPEKLSDGQVSALKAAFKEWKDADPPEALIVHDCEVVRVLDVDLVVDAPVAV